MHGSWVMQHYLSTLGINYVLPNDEQIAIAEKAAGDMPSWPDTGSVISTGSVIVVKLS